jgi:hypothetical protein
MSTRSLHANKLIQNQECKTHIVVLLEEEEFTGFRLLWNLVRKYQMTLRSCF